MLVVGCFECFGFLVKCAEASCFLEVVLRVFPLVAVTWDMFFIILGVQNLSFDRPVPPFSYPEDHFVSLVTPQRTMEGHMGAQNQNFSDFG